MNAQDERLHAIWKQQKIPVIYRQGGDKSILVRIPFARDNRAWLKEKPRQKEPEYSKQFKCWELPKSRFESLVRSALVRYDLVYVIQPYRTFEICSASCRNASGFTCECSCMGANHGSGNAEAWFDISETLAVRWNTREYACRLIKRNDTEQGAAANP